MSDLKKSANDVVDKMKKETGGIVNKAKMDTGTAVGKAEQMVEEGFDKLKDTFHKKDANQ